MAYNKTNWQNLPSTTTPVYGPNLNKIETQLDTLTPYVLYDSTAEDDGTQTGFTLSDSASNYNYLEFFFYRFGTSFKNVKIYKPNNKYALLDMIAYVNNVARIYSLQINISGTSCTFGDKFRYNFGTSTQANVAPTVAETNIRVYRVLGYK